MKNKKIIGKGAEAIISLVKKSQIKNPIKGGQEDTKFHEGDGGGDKSLVKKTRISKSYRLPELDKKIIKRRTKAETKIMLKASKIIPIPKPKNQEKENEIIMPFINGEKLSEYLDSYEPEKEEKIMYELGKSIAKLHKEGIIHGDLTTSNMIYDSPKEKVFLIDFGLAFQNGKYEDKGVDIHLLKQALEAKHFRNWQILFKEFEVGYRLIEPKEADKVFNRMKAIEKRGRYRH